MSAPITLTGRVGGVPGPGRMCVEDGCDGAVWARERCNRHYLRWRKANPELIHRPEAVPILRPCAPPVCSGKPMARGMCSRHYQMWRKSQPGPIARQTSEDRFWAKVDKRGPAPDHCPELGPCWVWIKALSHAGYGKLTLRKQSVMAHRVSYEMAYGVIPVGLHVCHRCDNPPCVNPSHLFLGTRSDNMRDMYAKGRGGGGHLKGERSAQARLTDAQVCEIRTRFAQGERRDVLAAAYGIYPTTVSEITSGRARADAPGPIRVRVRQSSQRETTP